MHKDFPCYVWKNMLLNTYWEGNSWLIVTKYYMVCVTLFHLIDITWKILVHSLILHLLLILLKSRTTQNLTLNSHKSLYSCLHSSLNTFFFNRVKLLLCDYSIKLVPSPILQRFKGNDSMCFIFTFLKLPSIMPHP